MISEYLIERANLEEKLVNAAYQTGKSLEDAVKRITEQNKEWQVLTQSHEDKESELSQFKAVAFINRTEGKKEILIAHAGTKVSQVNVKQSAQDIWADLQLAAKITPELKLEAIKAFVTKIQSGLANEGENCEDYTFSTTGHSLGSVLSDLTAVELSSRGLEVKDSITFDNPGSRPVINHALENGLFTNNITISEIESRIEFASIQAQAPNFISRTNTQMGKMCVKVQDIRTAEAKHVKETAPAKVSEDSGASYVSYLYGKVGSVVNTVAPFLNLDKMTSAFNYIKGYSDPEILNQISKDVQVVKNGLIKKIQEEIVQPFEDVKSDVFNVTADLATISLGVATLCSGSFMTAIPLLAYGSHSLFNDGGKLAADVKTACNKLGSFVHSLSVVDGHSMKHFGGINEHNIMEVKSGAGNEGTQLVLYVNPHQFKKLEDLKNEAYNQKHKASLDIQPVEKSESWGSWAYKHLSNARNTIQNALQDQLEDTTYVKLVNKENDASIVLSHEQLRSFCLKGDELSATQAFIDFEDGMVDHAAGDEIISQAIIDFEMGIIGDIACVV